MCPDNYVLFFRHVVDCIMLSIHTSTIEMTPCSRDGTIPYVDIEDKHNTLGDMAEPLAPRHARRVCVRI